MEFKKKTIIGEDNNEPPKDYIWIKSDGKAYEFDYNDRTGKESTSLPSGSSSESACQSGVSGFSEGSVTPSAYGIKDSNDNGTIIDPNEINLQLLNTHAVYALYDSTLTDEELDGSLANLYIYAQFATTGIDTIEFPQFLRNVEIDGNSYKCGIRM